ncbi:hypothetical protein ACLBWT_16650 [Paenibacillus sp. D51F]
MKQPLDAGRDCLPETAGGAGAAGAFAGAPRSSGGMAAASRFSSAAIAALEIAGDPAMTRGRSIASEVRLASPGAVVKAYLIPCSRSRETASGVYRP